MDITNTIKLRKPYPWQVEILKTPKRHRLIIASRRIGKTEIAKYAAILELLHGKKVLWVAPVYSQTVEIYRSIADTISSIVSYKSTNKELHTVTGGKMWFRSADNPDALRSLGYDLVIFDEFAFSNQEAWKVIRPTLAENKGRFMAITSPSGHNFVHDLYQKMKFADDWYCCQLPWSVSPHLTKEEIAKAESEMLASEFRQEFMASFESPTGALFQADWLRDIMIPESDWPTNDTFARKMIAVDQSAGRIHSDLQGVVFVGVKDQMLYVDAWGGRLPIPDLCKQVKAMGKTHSPEAYVWESNGFGALAADEFMRQFTIQPPVLLVNSAVEKNIRIARLGTYFSRRQVKILDNPGGRMLHAQASDWPKGAQHGSFDLLDAFEMAIRALTN